MAAVVRAERQRREREAAEARLSAEEEQRRVEEERQRAAEERRSAAEKAARAAADKAAAEAAAEERCGPLLHKCNVTDLFSCMRS